jgi:hypothetical protein
LAKKRRKSGKSEPHGQEGVTPQTSFSTVAVLRMKARSLGTKFGIELSDRLNRWVDREMDGLVDEW